MRFRSVTGDAPILAITECGNEMMLTIAFVGSVEYMRGQSDELADMLESAAKMVRKQQ